MSDSNRASLGNLATFPPEVRSRVLEFVLPDSTVLFHPRSNTQADPCPLKGYINKCRHLNISRTLRMEVLDVLYRRKTRIYEFKLGSEHSKIPELDITNRVKNVRFEINLADFDDREQHALPSSKALHQHIQQSITPALETLSPYTGTEVLRHNFEISFFWDHPAAAFLAAPLLRSLCLMTGFKTVAIKISLDCRHVNGLFGFRPPRISSALDLVKRELYEGLGEAKMDEKEDVGAGSQRLFEGALFFTPREHTRRKKAWEVLL